MHLLSTIVDELNFIVFLLLRNTFVLGQLARLLKLERQDLQQEVKVRLATTTLEVGANGVESFVEGHYQRQVVLH